MSRSIQALWAALFIVSAARADAMGSGAVRFHLNSGVALSPTPQTSSESNDLPGTSFAFGGGVLMRLADPLCATADADVFRLGRPADIGGWIPEARPSVGASNMATVMLGLRLEGTRARVAQPYLTAAAGLGRFTEGDLRADYMDGSSVTTKGRRETAPAYSLGMGVRGRPFGGPVETTVGVRWVGMFTKGGTTNLLPLEFGIGI
jgi:hypothetical protein